MFYNCDTLYYDASIHRGGTGSSYDNLSEVLMITCQEFLW
jgi:hypothetical protein